MTARAWSVALVGMNGTPVEVEAAIGGGLPKVVLVGLPDASLGEARDRCKAAVTSSKLPWPSQLVTINLSPAMLPKAGSHYDLAIVAAVLAAAETVRSAVLDRMVFWGELSLDGRVRAVRGILPGLLAARRVGLTTAVVPAAQLAEAQLVEGLTIWPVATLIDVIEVLHGRPSLAVVPEAEPKVERRPEQALDLADVAGQPDGRWALEVAAAGRHHLYFHGPPGVGKTLLAARLPTILPELQTCESVEVSAVHSLCGLSLRDGLIRRPPLAAPHHSASVAALVGGGPRIAMPGSVSLAHRGVLFLDEAPEFDRRALEALRLPLEEGEVRIARSVASITYPARFQLVLAANPCPCGNAGTPGAECRCSPHSIRRYGERLSGPILDRVDLHQQLRPLRRAFLADALRAAEPSAAVADRVQAARERQARRLEGTPWATNGEVPGGYLRRELSSPEADKVLSDATARGLSARGVDKVLRLAWTLADLGARQRPQGQDFRVALAMRRGETLMAAS